MNEHEGCQIVRLAAEGELETWLDLTTGRQLVGRVKRGPAAAATEERRTSAATPLIEVAIAALEAGGWTSYEREEEGVVTYAIRGRRAGYDGVVVANEEARFLSAYCVFAPRVPEARRAAMLEAIARANFGLHTGAFEMDLDDGELRFRDGANLGRHLPSVSMVRDLIRFAIFMCDRYHDALMGVAFGGAEPAAAIAAVEERA